MIRANIPAFVETAREFPPSRFTSIPRASSFSCQVRVFNDPDSDSSHKYRSKPNGNREYGVVAQGIQRDHGAKKQWEYCDGQLSIKKPAVDIPQCFVGVTGLLLGRRNRLCFHAG